MASSGRRGVTDTMLPAPCDRYDVAGAVLPIRCCRRSVADAMSPVQCGRRSVAGNGGYRSAGRGPLMSVVV
jgi:hypothetical protein